MEEHAENQNYFLPNDDIFTAYLNADSDKPNIRLQYTMLNLGMLMIISSRNKKNLSPHLLSLLSLHSIRN